MVAITTQTFVDIFTHPIFLAAFFSFLLSQTVKIILLLYNKKEYALKAIYQNYGGMPSTHTAVVSAITFSILFSEGVSNLFILSFFWATFIISDVLSVKWFFGPRNIILHEVVEVLDNRYKKKLKDPPMAVGHSPKEVIVGLVIAFAVSYLIYFVVM
ncbi:divergent PAP2 family protein [archaeon]|jgi:uncharacterized protein|nr:divergent PAP2 family protein [archaeon]MBT6762599.1 divergent PAP2 family protein [archaeon]